MKRSCLVLPASAPQPSRGPRRHAMTRAALALGLALQMGLAAAQAQRYDIPAQPLAPALNALAAQSGLQLVFAHELAQGKQAPAVSGNHEVGEALRLLLAGSGLRGRVQGKTLVVERAAPVATPVEAAAAESLAEVKVTASAVRDGTSEGTGSYQASATNTATKLTLTPRDTPQTVTTITRQQMDDAGMTSVDDALEAVSGVFVLDHGANGGVYYSRGFALQAQFDGMAAPGGISDGNRAPRVDSAFFDRVEVLQGAAGLLTGAGEPGGTINLVRKRPTDSFQAQAEVQLSSWNARRLVGDVGGPLTDSGHIRGRVVAVVDNAKSFTDYAYRNRRGAYGIVEADLTPGTQVSASIQYQQDMGRDDFGAPFAADGSDAGLPRSSYWGDAKQRQSKNQTVYTLGLSQQLAGEWNLKAAIPTRERPMRSTTTAILTAR